MSTHRPSPLIPSGDYWDSRTIAYTDFAQRILSGYALGVERDGTKWRKLR